MNQFMKCKEDARLSPRDRRGGSCLTAIGLGLCIPLLTGCGNSGDLLPLNSVTGQVRCDGEPLEGASVVFYPVGGSERLQDLRPRGTTNVDGRFQLQTYLPGDGAPVGEFKVTIEWYGKPAPEDSTNERHDAIKMRPNLLLETFAAPESTPVNATISNGNNTLEPFQVKLAPQK